MTTAPLPPGALVRVRASVPFRGIRRAFAGRVGRVVVWDPRRVVVDFETPPARETFLAHHLEPVEPPPRATGKRK